MAAPPRLYLDQPFAPGQTVALTEGAANYLFAVLRLGVGASVAVFNGQDGAWLARVALAGKRAGALLLGAQVAPQIGPPDLWLIFAPLKKVRTDMLVEKAVELGVARLLPVQTDFTQAERLRDDKLRAHAIEAAEQCGATYVPAIAPVMRLSALLDGWEQGRALIWCDAALAPDAAPAGALPPAPAAVLIGPEGGFSPAERARLAGLPFAHPLRLGPRILRAETAALAAVTLWQAAQGDWR